MNRSPDDTNMAFVREAAAQRFAFEQSLRNPFERACMAASEALRGILAALRSVLPGV